ncbi:phospholipase D-like domain-containing protein [Paenibacillus glacialis]|uniref:phospholipase D n=1 Tax=Paenibacillus glacialis TaxID=494026 RepID=A0A168D0D4_9BACL|nr:phospholipase D-like domain-containing protein [Paenibacillus glacialis]OAB33767.1 phosphatidylserine synthase [Paenibacillus glacialis]
MDSEKFLKTMIEIVKYGDYENKSELLTILRKSIITFRKTSSFTRKSYQCWENVELRVPVPLFNVSNKYHGVFNNIASELYIETEGYDYSTLMIKPRLIESELYEVSEHDVVFNEIQDTIIQGIRSAKYVIWIAVAWFIDTDIFKELVQKQKEGLDIKVIISDDKGNDSLVDKLEEKFELVKVPKTGYFSSNIMHDKFCIIDLEYVMHGSYNWSKNAQYNDETLATALDRDFVYKFADEFKRLYVLNR